MKNAIKVFGIVTLAVIITFGMMSCGGGGGPSGDPDTGDPNTGDPNNGGKPFLVELNPSSITFPPAEVGYSTQAVVAVTVKNTGTEYTNNLNVTIVDGEGSLSTDFVSPATITPVASIAPGANGTFNIGPADGLLLGGYAATVNVFNTGGDIHESITVLFVVQPSDGIFRSIADFKAALDNSSANTPDTAYPFKMNISDLGEDTFNTTLRENKTKFVSLDLSGSTFTSIGDYAFKGCTGLVSVTIPLRLTSIGEQAFNFYSGLTSITIPNRVTSIGDYAFYNCTGLTSVTFGGTITSANFSSESSFPGDLRTKYLAGGVGTYTTTAPVTEDSVWVKQ